MKLATQSVEWYDLISFYVITIDEFHLKTLLNAPIILTFILQHANIDEAVLLCRCFIFLYSCAVCLVDYYLENVEQVAICLFFHVCYCIS